MATLPNQQRAEDIVAEARRRLADSGGKASMLQQMIQKVTNDFASDDALNVNASDRAQQYQQPNNIDSYIDKVLQMSGMTEAPARSAMSSGVGGEVSGAPVEPVERAPLPDAEPNPANDAAAAPDENSLMDEFMMLAGVGGTAWAAYQLFKKYGKQVGTDGRVVVDNPDPEARARTEAAAAVNADSRGAIDNMIDAIDGDTGKQARLAGPEEQRLLEGPSEQMDVQRNQVMQTNPVDESIDRTMSQEDIDQVFQDRVEGRDNSMRTGPNRFNESAAADPIEEAIRLWQDGDVDGAVRIMRENDIPAQTLRERLNAVTGAARNAASDAARGAVRLGVR